MKVLSGLIVLALTWSAVLGALNVSITRTNNGGIHAPGDLIFEDNFDKLDFTKWQHERTMSGGGNWEFQIYDNRRVNSYTKNGVLYIKPTLTNDFYGENFVETGTLSMLGGSPADQCTNPSFYGCERSGAGGNIINPTMSARLRTVNSFNFKYGRVEVRAKIPAGDWLWPAIWMLPTYNPYGTWPASGEVDIMESRGNRQLFDQQGNNIGAEHVGSTLHFGPYWPYDAYEKVGSDTYSSSNAGFDRDFHVYGIEWTDQYISYLLDGRETRRITPPAGGFWELGSFPADAANPWEGAENPRMAPFDQEFYLILNLAVGGTNGYFPDTTTGTRKPWSNTGGNAFLDFWNARNEWYPTWNGDDASFQVDYVRVYAV